jgi:hypothetical protein
MGKKYESLTGVDKYLEECGSLYSLSSFPLATCGRSVLTGRWSLFCNIVIILHQAK